MATIRTIELKNIIKNNQARVGSYLSL